MAVPTKPTVATIVAVGLKQGGITNPTTAQTNEAINDFLQEIKSDIGFFSKDHRRLKTTDVILCIVGQSRYAWPSNANTIGSIVRLEGPDNRRGTAQAGANLTITLASDFDFGANDVNMTVSPSTSIRDSPFVGIR